MENDHKFHLPVEIIHQIQSSMPEKYAAQTSLLSKSWHDAWCTCADLVFKQPRFQPEDSQSRNCIEEFTKFTKKTMQKYEDLNLKLKAFRLWMNSNHPLARELVLKAIKLGAVDFSIEFKSFVLPHEVFESKTLARLSVSGLTVDLQKRVTTCSNLKSLKLSNATVLNGDLVRDLVSRCPLIEELTWDKPKVLFGEEKILSCFCDLEEFDNNLKLDKLKYMCLSGLVVEDTLYRGDLSPKFPCLKELVIWEYYSNHVKICSPSLEHITIRLLSLKTADVEFDVPNIRKFRLISSHVPCLVMRTSSSQWESEIDMKCALPNSSASWYSSLGQLVRTLSLSRVSLAISVDIWACRFHRGYAEYSLPIPAVENLTVFGRDLTFEFLVSLLRICRPNFLSFETRCLVGMGEELRIRQLQSLPRTTLFHAFNYELYFHQGCEFIRIQIN